MYCSVHARAVAEGSDLKHKKGKKGALTEALRVFDERRQAWQKVPQEQKRALERMRDLSGSFKPKVEQPADPAECYMWYEPDDSDEERKKQKGRCLCLLCSYTVAEKTHVASKKHKAQVARYTNYLKRERIASTEKAVCEFAALCIEDAGMTPRVYPSESSWAISAHPCIFAALVPAHPKPALCAKPKTKSTNRVVHFKHTEKMVMKWIHIVRGGLNLCFRKRLVSAFMDVACPQIECAAENA